MTIWKYSVIMKMKPNSPKKAIAVVAEAALKRGFRKNRISSRGDWLRTSQTTKSVSRSAAPTKPRTLVRLAQP